MMKLLNTVRSSRLMGLLAASAGVWALSGAASVAQARDNVYWSIGVNSPGVSVGVTNTRPVAVYPAPVVVHSPPPVVYAPPPVVYAPPPVVYHPRPSRSVRAVSGVVVQQPPVVVYAPPPYHRHWDGHPGRGHKHGHRHWRDDDDRYDRDWDRHDDRKGGRRYHN